VNHFFELVLDIIFPPQCLICKKKLEDHVLKVVCKNCFQKIGINNGFFCPKCKKRLYEPKNNCHPETKFILAAATFFENEIIRELIYALKYKNLKSAVEPIFEILKIYLEKICAAEIFESNNFLIIPVPLHKKRERARGFNQTQLLAQKLSLFLNNVQIEKNALIKTKNTKSQTELNNYEEREKNIAGSFAANEPQKIKGRNIILLDDVFTSGATMKEAVRILKEVGAKKIIGLVIVKT